MTTIADLRRVFPRGDLSWLAEVLRQAPVYGIDTPAELASFLAQVGHETAGMTRFEESLSYGSARMMAVWPRRFPDISSTLAYAHRPEELAERVYGGRMGNVAPGDGWRYRGRGPMVTGRRNYGRAGELVGLDLIEHPEWLLDPVTGVQVACAGWRALGLDWSDDDADARAETRRINGGEIGLMERQALLDRLRAVLGT